MSKILSKPKYNDFQALAKWILPCITGYSAVFGKYKNNAVTIIPDIDEIVSTNIKGISTFTKNYAIQCYFAVAENTIISSQKATELDFNIKIYETAQSINQWIIEQNKNNNYPIVDDWETIKVEPTNLMPNFDGVDDANLARYTIFVSVTYEGIL